MFLLVMVTVISALAFDFLNGFHDAANSIATVVSTRVLSPMSAVAWAAFFNFAAFLILGTRVAKTIGGDMISIDLITPELRLPVLLAGILGAIVWNIITWYLGLPTSSSHALIGGYAGAAIFAHQGFEGLLKPAGWIKILSFIIASPVIGLLLGFTFMIIVYWIFRRSTASRIDKLFGRGQLISAALYSLGHGGNDAQKTMGIIMAVLVSGGIISSGTGGKLPEIPLWVALTAHASIGIGTLFGGWRIVRTMGRRITKLRCVGGFCAESAGALTLLAETLTGIPVSTTQTITGAIVGVGSTSRLSGVRWGVAGRIVWAWILTIPCTALVATTIFFALKTLVF